MTVRWGLLTALISLQVVACSHPLLKGDEESVTKKVATDPTPAAKVELTSPSTAPVSEPIHAPMSAGAKNSNGSPLSAAPASATLTTSAGATAGGSEVFDTDEIHFQIQEKYWEKMSDEDGIQSFERRTEKGLNPYGDNVAFRGEAVIPARIPKIATILSDDNLQKEWVDSLADAKTLERASAFEDIEYNRTSLPWPFQDRDFVYRVFVRVQNDPPVLLLTMKTTEDPRMPPIKGVVRGEILYSFFYLKEMPDHKSTKMVIEMAVDPKGAIPHWLVKLSQKNWPHNTLAQLRTLSLRDNIAISPEVQKYFDQPKESKKK